MNRKILITGGAFFIALFLFAFFYYTNDNNEEVVKDKMENENAANENNKDAEDEIEDDDDIEKSSLEIKNEEILASMNDEMGRFEQDGKACQTIDDVINRGDCFQMINSSYMDWPIDTSKDVFYFPAQTDQGHWEQIFHYTIDNDKLDKVQETDYYDEHENANQEIMKRGIRMIEDYWHVFSNFIPYEFRTNLSQVNWVDTGKDTSLSVGIDESDVSKNTLNLSHNIATYDGKAKGTLIHEFGHVLTLNAQQVHIPTEEEVTDAQDYLDEVTRECSTYDSTWGCTEEDSYLYAYYEAFWQDIIDSYNSIDWESEEDYKDFFNTNEDRFFNSYQGTSPEEDIADAFSQFIMIPKREIDENDAIKYDKLAFFYQYDELVQLRTDILENMLELSVEDNEMY